MHESILLILTVSTDYIPNTPQVFLNKTLQFNTGFASFLKSLSASQHIIKFYQNRTEYQGSKIYWFRILGCSQMTLTTLTQAQSLRITNLLSSKPYLSHNN